MNMQIQVDSTIRSHIQTQRDAGRRAWLHAPGMTGECENCGGGGLLIIQVTETGPFKSPQNLRGAIHTADGWFSTTTQSVPCPVCSQWKTRFEHSGLLPHEYPWTIDYLRGRAGKLTAYTAAATMLAKLPEVSGLLALFGDYGMGKTGLLKAAVATACRAGLSARYIRASDIVAEATATFHDDDHTAQDASEGQTRQRYAGYRLLAIDEIDRTGGGDWTRQFLHSIFDQRYANRVHCATLLATNCNSADALPAHLGYLASRLDDAACIHLAGEYLRGKK